MACCKCCCECCGPPGEKTCCKGTAENAKYCCNEQACCNETDVCCDPPRCCPENTTCCGTEECCLAGEHCCGGECQPEPCGHWCQVAGLDDSERVVCVADRDPDRAAIQRTGELLNIEPPPCLQPGGTCFECLAYATICTDPGLPEGWEGLNWTCAEAREFAELQITNFLSGTFDCEFEIVEKLREDRAGLEAFDPDLGQFVPLPNAFVKRDWIGCCNQEDAPP